VWLQAKLVAENRGVLVPPLPEKQPTGLVTGAAFSANFISERRRGLEKFLLRLSVHEVLQSSKVVHDFLHADDASFASLKVEKKEPAPGQKSGFLNFFNESYQAFSNIVGAGAERPKTAEDIDCEGVLEYATLLEKQLEKVHTSAEELVAKTKALSTCWFEFSLQAILLGQYESKNEEEVLGQICCKLGNTADKLSHLLTKKANDEDVQFREQFKDYLKYTLCVQELCRSRAATLLTYQTSLGILEARQADLSKAQGVPGKEAAARTIEVQVAEAQRDADRDRAELERVTRSALAEAARFRREKEQDIRRVIIDFVKMQIQQSRQAQETWESLLPEIDGNPQEDA